MSAILGVISLNGELISKELLNKASAEIAKFPHDYCNEHSTENAFLFNIVKHYTPESKFEHLPGLWKEYNLVIIADAVIDNRDELAAIFKISESEKASTPDSTFIILAYIKWGEDCLKYLVGDFAFAIWNESKKELFCARDHVGKRTLYYFCKNKTFAFSTTVKPLLVLLGKSNGLNEEWIADYLAVDLLMHEFDCRKTIHNNVLQILPGHLLQITNNKVTSKKYWEPGQKPKLIFKQDDDYVKAFKEIYYESINCRLRNINKIGLMLSGGLDSGSIACVAAPILKEKGKKLYGYTSIPFAGYKDWLPNSSIANEKEFIQNITSMYNNIEVKYRDFSGINSYSSIDELLEIYEQPYKIAPNLYWVNEMTALAAKDNCGVLLNGQFGNFSISFGYEENYLITLYKQYKYIKMFKELLAFRRYNQLSFKPLFKSFCKMLLAVQKNNANNMYSSTMIINSKFAQENDVFMRLEKAPIALGPYAKKFSDINEMQALVTSGIAFNQCGVIESKLSLEHGVLNRDPTRDKRVIEYCLSMPDDQFVKQGQDRSLIRRAMKNIMPDQIRLNNRVRGSQSSDWIQRLHKDWEAIRNEILSFNKDTKIQKYIDTEKVENMIIEQGELPGDKSGIYVQAIMNSLIFSRYINKYS